MNGVGCRRLFVAVVMLTVIASPSATTQVIAEDEGMYFENFKVPEYDENNVKKSELLGEEAVVRENGDVDITRFQLDLYNEGTNVEMRITGPQCVYNQKARVAKSKKKVKIEGEKFTVTGIDFAWDRGREVFKIFKDSKLVLQRDQGRVKQLKRSGSGDKNEE